MESNIIHTCDPTLTFPIADFELDLLIILISACLNNSTIKEYCSIKIIISNQIQLIQYTHSHTCTCIYNQLMNTCMYMCVLGILKAILYLSIPALQTAKEWTMTVIINI